jgi:hypothetical protein
MDMDCKACKENLAAYLDGQLMAPEQRAVATHIEVCKPCAQFYEELRDLDGIFNDPATVLEPPARTWDHIQTALRSSEGRPPMAYIPNLASWRQVFKQLTAWTSVHGVRVRHAAAALAAIAIFLFLGIHYYLSYKTERQMLAQIDNVQQAYLQAIDQNPFGEAVPMGKLDDNPFETINLENEKNPFRMVQ